MFARLDAAKSLTGNQLKIVAAAIIGDMLEFFDYFLIAFVLAFIIKPWQLTGGQSAIILLSSGIGAILGAFIWGRIADVYGRRQVFILTVLNFSIASGLLYFTPENGWIYLSVMRFFVGFGVGGLYCVDLPLVQEFVPARMRGFIGGLVTVFIPLGVMIASSFAAFFTNAIGWRGLFVIGLLPAAFTLVIRGWVPGPCRSHPKHYRWQTSFRPRKMRRGAICLNIHAAWQCPGWRVSARKPPVTGSSCGRRRCSFCSSALPRPMRRICSFGFHLPASPGGWPFHYCQS
jgi:MFS family permease